MRAAIIGTGLISHTHASALLHQQQTLALCVGTSVEKAKAFAEQWKIEAYSDCFEDALQEGIDCVHICTPPTLHYEMVKAALLAGKHVVCEKPLTLRSSEAKELWDLARKCGKMAAVNFNVRYYEACQKARELAQSGVFGRQLLVHGSYLQQFALLPCTYMWRYISEVGGSMRCVTEIGSHWFDLMRYITGHEIVEVSADFGKFFPQRFVKDGQMYPESMEGSTPIQVDSEDTATVMFRLDNGAKGCVMLSQMSHGRSNRVAFEISGTRQSLWWNSEDPLKLHTAGADGIIHTQVNAFAGSFPNTHEALLGEVYGALRDGRAPAEAAFPNFYDGCQAAAVCEAIYESAMNDAAWTAVG